MDLCFAQLSNLLPLKHFGRLQTACRDFQTKVQLILRQEDRDRSQLSRVELDFLGIDNVIARSLGRDTTYEPTNEEVRTWVQEFERAEERMLMGQDSEEETYDPYEHVSFHAALAVHYLSGRVPRAVGTTPCSRVPGPMSL